MVNLFEFILELLPLFFPLGTASACEVQLTDSRKIIMKLYVFLVNTGTTLTFDTELTVQT